MKIDRLKNSSRNIVSGLLLNIYKIIMPFVMRTVMLYVLGIQYLGLNSLFISVLQVLNLAELGVGSAMVYSMYKPIVDDNEREINALMALYRRYYRVVGIVVLVLGLAILPVIDKLVKADTVPEDINIYVIYILNLASTVLSYWLFAYKNSVLSAHQREDIINNINLAVSSVLYAVQIVLLVAFKNYYLYVTAIVAAQAVINILTAYWSQRLYPKYNPQGRLSAEKTREINGRVRDLFTSKVGSTIVSSADTIVISSFLGLGVLAVYQNYYFIMMSVVTLIAVIFTACRAGIGNSLITEKSEKNFNDLKKLTLIISWICCICSACFLSVYQPFMRLWTGKDNLMKYSAVVCLVIYFYVSEINQLFNMYKDSAGIWHTDRFRPLITALSNLALNLLTVKTLGLYGVILSTVVSTLVVGMPWLLHNLFTTIFAREYAKGYIAMLIKYTAVSVLCCGIVVGIMRVVKANDFLCTVIGLLVSVTLPNGIMYMFFKNTKEFEGCKILLGKMTKGRFDMIINRL